MELFKQPRSKFWSVDLRIEGKRIRRSTGQTTRAKAGTVAAEMLRQIEGGTAPVAQAPTLSTFATQVFLPYLESHAKLADTTKSYYRLGWIALSRQPLADMALDAIRKPHIDTVQVAGSPATQNRSLRTLRRILNLAHELDAIPKVPKFTLMEETGRTHLITTDIEHRMAAQLALSRRHNSLGVALYLILDCGLRPKEIVHLEVPDCLNDRIQVTRQGTKTNSGVRLIPMTDRVRYLLFKHLAGRTAGWVFPSPRNPGSHINSKSLSVAWRKTANKAGVAADVDLYCARHTFGTDLMAATKNPFLTSRLMGHTDLDTTNRYQHPDLSGLAELMNARNATRGVS
jgi:integrase